jgi:S-adenosylmethionine synthetase
MKKNILISPLKANLPYEQDIEIVEKKGLGHPDTICDFIAEEISIALSKYYIDEFGSIMHHNVDKALLIGGMAEPSYNGGRITKPIEIVIAGRAIKEKGGKKLPIEEIAEQAAKKFLSRQIKHLNVESQIVINSKIGPGSGELIELFSRFSKGEVPLSNDTSAGAGFYPLDTLEKTVYETEKFLNSPEVKRIYPFVGEDIKVMGIRNKEEIRLTVAIATVDRYISSLEDYIYKIKNVREILLEQEWVGSNMKFDINTADSYERESIYLTVTGTSAEGGDDGQVGRGNRANGLITPYRPMTLEAVAGKNPISHVGKIYNLFAIDLCKKVVEGQHAQEAYAYIVSQIGKPINEPLVLDIQVKGKDFNGKAIRRIAEEMLDEMPYMWKKTIDRQYEIA